MSRRLRLTVAVVGGIAAITVVGACTGGSSGGGSSGGGSGATAGGAPVGGAAVGGSAVGGTAQRRAPSAAASAPDKSFRGPAAGAADGRLAAVDIGTAKIRIASMTVQVKRGATVAAQANRAEAIALGAGGEVDSDDRTSGRDAVATLVVRVPPEQLTPTLTQLSKLGVEKSRQLSTQDVTSKVADVNSRVASAKASIARLRVLFHSAHKIADVINLESELSMRESDLESLQAQQRALATETSTAAITLTLTSPPRRHHHPAPPKPAHHDSGFLAGLRGGWHAFVTGLVAVSTALGAALPFLLLIAVLAVVVRLLWPRLRPPHHPAPTE